MHNLNDTNTQQSVRAMSGRYGNFLMNRRGIQRWNTRMNQLPRAMISAGQSGVMVKEPVETRRRMLFFIAVLT